MIRGHVRYKLWLGAGAGLACWLCCASNARAQGGGFGGGQQGGGIGGQTGSSFGGGFSGTSSGSMGRNTFPGVTGGFRPLSSALRTSGARGGGQFGQGGGQFGQGGGQLGLGGGGLAGGRGLTNTVPTRITGAAVSENLRPIPPPVFDIQGRLEQLLSSAAGPYEGRTITIEIEGPTLVMRGMVKNDYEKQLSEALARLEPGVHDIRNELSVAIPRRPPADLPPGLEPPSPGGPPATPPRTPKPGDGVPPGPGT